jgi:hypothetical protein
VLPQELVALGAANLVGAFGSSYPVSGSFSRTAVSYESGSKTQFANLVSATAPPADISQVVANPHALLLSRSAPWWWGWCCFS